MRTTPSLTCALLLTWSSACSAALHGSVHVPSAPHESAQFHPYAGRASSLPTHARHARGLVTDAVLYLESVPAAVDSTLPSPGERPRLAQKDESFVPRVVAVAVGGSIDFPNMDPIYHNVFSVSPVRRFDLGKYPRGQSRTVRFQRAGVVNVFCDIHADMAAFILVLPNRAFARPDENGGYRLPDVPPGHYVLKWWHPDYPPGQRDVVIPADRDAVADVSF